MTTAAVEIEQSEGKSLIGFSGSVLIGALTDLQDKLAGMERARDVVIDLTQVDALDTAGAWLIVNLSGRLEAEGVQVSVEGASEPQTALLKMVRDNLPDEMVHVLPPSGFLAWLNHLGQRTAHTFGTIIELVSFLGQVIASIAGVLVRPWRLRTTALVHHMQEAGYNAVPIVSLMAFLIGVVLAFQGAEQLRQFGAEIFVVDLIAIAVLRELGILLTAIIVAGRSGSAMTASIGSMKMREEIDAMRTLGLDPIEVLVVPRVLALIIMLPALGFIADLMGLIGGSLLSWITLGVSPEVFLTRMVEGVSVKHFLVGMIKAPFFALIIGIVGCYQGLKVEGNAESLGRLTSKSVVMAIFMVIVADAIFSIFFSLIGM
jgi:phospholipid/cholesterol/gamma-HCH transport system permease protein